MTLFVLTAQAVRRHASHPKPFQPIWRYHKPYQSSQLLPRSRIAGFSSAKEASQGNFASGAIGVLQIAFPSALLMYGVLQYFDPHQRGAHSHEMKQRLQDENKRSGRAHGCQEVHVSGIEKWVATHPEHGKNWDLIKKMYEGEVN